MRMVGGTSRPSERNALRPSGPCAAVNVMAASRSCDRTTGGSGSDTVRPMHERHTSAAVNTIQRLMVILRDTRSMGWQVRYQGSACKRAVGRMDQHRVAQTALSLFTQ